MQDDEMLTLSQAAEVVGLSESYLRSFCQNGNLPAERIEIGSRHIWRVARPELLAWKAVHDSERGKPGRKPNV